MQIKKIDPRILVPHPLNQSTFGDIDIDPDLIASLKRNKNGLTSPVVCIPAGRKTSDGMDLPDLTIVVGHRRVRNAIEAGLKTVPVLINDELENANDIELALLCDNDPRVRRKMTESQKIRLFIAIKQRLELQSRYGEVAERPREAAAKAVGMSDKTARDGAAVVTAIDNLNAAGETEKAEELADILDNESVSAAKRAVMNMPQPLVPIIDPPKYEPPKKSHKKKRSAEQSKPPRTIKFMHPDIKGFDQLSKLVTRLSNGVADMAKPDKAGITIETNAIMENIESIRRAIVSWKNSHASNLRKKMSAHGTQSSEKPSSE